MYVILEKEHFYFYEAGPKLLDVSITNFCKRQCKFCYKSSSQLGKQISYDDYKIIIVNAIQCGVKQIAIGGGEPTSHPDFIGILKFTRENGIVPNYSTNGDDISDEIMQATKKYCGAVAISIYDNIDEYQDIVERFLSHNCLTNLHIVLRNSEINNIVNLLKKPPKWFSKLNALIFLNFKPFNNEIDERINNSPLIKSFFKKIKSFKICSIGFDTCTVSYINKFLKIDKELYDYCEAGRRSAYINENLEVLPCSFYKNKGENLRNTNLLDIWLHNDNFIQHRKMLQEKFNINCEYVNICGGGCLIYQINYCKVCE
jgi:radical SAM protein with 4Fe4S-binding SPASM domain